MARSSIWVLLCCLAPIGLLQAAGQVLLAHGTGTIEIARDGRVAAVQLDERFGAVVNAPLEQLILDRWRFEPVVENGRPVHAVARMSVQLKAVERADGELQVAINDVSFVETGAAAESLRARVQPPRYPPALLRERLSAAIDLLVEVTPDGRVKRAAPLDGWLMPGSSARRRADPQRFNEVAVEAVLEWQLDPFDGDEPRLLVVPIRFEVDDGKVWRQATRLESSPEPWMTGTDRSRLAVLGAGAAAPSRLRLTTSLDGSPAG